MKCIYCSKQKNPIRLGGLISINCCGKIQVLKYSLRPKLRKIYESDPDIILVDKIV